MKNQDFRINNMTVWILVIGNFLLSIFGTYAKIHHWSFSQNLLTICLILFFMTWIIIISDMIKNKISNKPFWIISMFILPTISPIFYLIQRNILIRHIDGFWQWITWSGKNKNERTTALKSNADWSDLRLSVPIVKFILGWH